MSRTFLAIDVGGSTSRAYLVDEAGRCLGHGRNRGGNPASNTPELAASFIISAVEQAVAEAGPGPFDIEVAQIALAGPQAHVAVDRLDAAFRRLGLSGPIVFAGDVVAMFASVTLATEGYCMIVGTGAGCVRIRGGEVERVVDLAGWLLGDLGSGYWLGHEAAKAVCAHLEERGEATALTAALLQAMRIAPDFESSTQGRSLALRHFIDSTYAHRPIELARFAPLVFAHRTDPVAARLIKQAEQYLVSHFSLVYDPAMPGPVGLGGGVIGQFIGLREGISEVIRRAGHEPDIRLVADGSTGAIVLALRAAGIEVDEATLQRIAASVAERKLRQ